MKMRILARLVLVLLASSSCAVEVGEVDRTDPLAESLGELLSNYEQYGFSGAVLVSRGGAVLLERGYGYANRETGERNTADTRFDFSSIAKTFTGAAVLALESEGILSVDDRLEDHLGPFSDERKSGATIHHLATHTAGLAHRSQSALDYSEDRDRWILSMKEAPFESDPGSSYRYSNAGASFLAALVEEVAGEPFEDFVRARLFEPLGMDSTGFWSELEFGEAGVALGYGDESKTAAPAEYANWTWGLKGSTGIVSTVGDIHRWFEAMSQGDLLSPDQYARAFDPEETEAFGWHTETDEKGRTFIHKGGGLNAMQTQILAYPDQEVVIVWAHNNMARNWRRALNRGLTAIALGDPLVLPPALTAAQSGGVEMSGLWETDGGTLLELDSGPEGLLALGNGFGMPQGLVRKTVDGPWVSFDVERVTLLTLRPQGDSLEVVLEPEAERLLLHRSDSSGVTIEPLAEPTVRALELGRQASAWLFTGETERIWEASAFRPVRGAWSREDWAKKAEFIAGRVGVEVRVVEEAWVKRNGSWRYWRTFESEAGMVVTMRFHFSSDAQVLSYGINPQGSEPEFDEKRVIG
jgi:CubicO group peptidase (beta-lactamase class C family)